jgi:NitT/TauT family transport system substrate-binding protein
MERIEDLKGGIVGVTAPGSSSHFLVNYLLARRGLAPEQVSVLGISAGATAIAAMERGKVDAGVLTDPTFTLLRKRHPDLRVLADTRNTEGVQAVYGVADYPASVLYAKEEWIRANPETARRLARAIHRVLRWIQEHSAEEIAAQMPVEFQAGDAASYVEALKGCRAMFSPDGLMPAEGPEAVRRVLGQSLEKVRAAQIDLGKTYTNEFVQ